MIYALLGSSMSLSMGPEATTALMTAIAITPLAAGDPVRYAHLATTLAVLIVAFSDDVLTARSFARRGEKINPNRELLALGVANAGSSLVHGFPVSSSATRTAIGVATGSRTHLYSLTTAASVVAVLLFLRPVLSLFPTAALGAIVIYAAIRLIDLPASRRLYAFRRAELAIALATCIAVLALDIVYGVLVAIGLVPGRPARGQASGAAGYAACGGLRRGCRRRRRRRRRCGGRAGARAGRLRSCSG